MQFARYWLPIHGLALYAMTYDGHSVCSYPTHLSGIIQGQDYHDFLFQNDQLVRLYRLCKVWNTTETEAATIE
jgi:hypothetical protein